MKQIVWTLENVYGYLFGWRFFAPIHHAIANLTLHALGYDNAYGNFSGEQWFIKNI